MKRFKLIFFMSLILTSILGTTSQANVTQEYVEYTFTHFKNTISNAMSSFSGNAKEILNTLTEQDYNFYTTYINQVLKENNLQNLTNHNMTSFISQYSSTDTRIYFIFSNTSSPNNVENLNYIKVARKNDTEITINGNETNGKIYILELRISKSTHNKFQPINIYNDNTTKLEIQYIKSATLNSDNTILTLSNVACTNTQAIYYEIPFTISGTKIIGQGFIRGLTTDTDPGYFKVETTTPSGDSSGGNTGDNTGGNTGTTNVDLSKVENGIKDINNNIENIKDKIPTSEDIKNATTSGVINGNNEYWGVSGELNGEKEQKEIKDIINGAMENVSGELSKNQVFKALESAEKGFFDLFKNKLEEQAYDLKFNWKKTEYQGATLLEDGEINISKMCREIPELGRLQFYIRLIFNFTVIINIIKQIYNLILATLGIDNPFLYEEGEQTTSIDTDTGEYKQYYRNKKRKLW